MTHVSTFPSEPNAAGRGGATRRITLTAALDLSSSLLPCTTPSSSRTMSSQQSLRPRRTHRRRRSSSASGPSIHRRRGTVAARSPSDIASLRFFVLSHIEEIERKLQSLDNSNARCSFSRQDQDETSGPESPCRSPPPEKAEIYS